jgi:hypothetical protein
VQVKMSLKALQQQDGAGNEQRWWDQALHNLVMYCAGEWQRLGCGACRVQSAECRLVQSAG